MHQLLFTVFVTGVCFFNCAGSEEHVSEPKGENHKRNTGTHEAYHSGVEFYHNHEGYGPPRHNHNGYQPPVAEPRSFPGSNADSWNDFHSRPRNPQNWNTPQFPPGFKHTAEFHLRNSEHSGKPETVDMSHLNKSIKEIPMEFLQKFDMYDVDELLLNYVEGYEDDDLKPLFTSRFGSDTQERKAASTPSKARCTPENTTVPLTSSDDPSILFIPKCTKIERCNGCCSHRLLECQPTEIETITVQVIKVQYTGGKKLQYVSKELVPLERHLKCKCDCKHCLPHQTYKKEDCECVCTNPDEEEKCYTDVDRKYWDIDTCSCKCIGSYECSTGSIYDHNECRCKTAPKRRYASLEKRAHNSENLHVAPL